MTQFVDDRENYTAEFLNSTSFALRTGIVAALPEQYLGTLGEAGISDDSDADIAESVENPLTLLLAWGKKIEENTTLVTSAAFLGENIALTVHLPSTSAQEDDPINYFDNVSYLLKVEGQQSNKITGLRSTGVADTYDFYVGSVWKEQVVLPVDEWNTVSINHSVADSTWFGRVYMNDQPITEQHSHSAEQESAFSYGFEGASASLQLSVSVNGVRVTENAGVVLYDNISLSPGVISSYIYLVSAASQTNYTEGQVGASLLTVNMAADGTFSVDVG